MDAVQQLREAIATIIKNDGPVGTAGTIQNLCGRSTDVIRDQLSLGEATLPIGTYGIDSYDGYGAEGEISVAFSAEGAGAPSKVNALLARAEALLTAPALLAAGIDASPIGQPAREPLDQEPEDETKPSLVIGSTRIRLLIFA